MKRQNQDNGTEFSGKTSLLQLAGPSKTLAETDNEKRCRRENGIWKKVFQMLVRPGALGLLVAGLLLYGGTYLMGTFGKPIRSDGMGYSMYLSGWVVHRSFGVEKAALAHFGEKVPTWTGCERAGEDGRLVDKYGVGVAVMALPFFLAAHTLTWWMQSPSPCEWWAYQFPMDGFSPIYQHAMGVSGLFWMWLGVVVSHWHLRRYFSRMTAAWTVGILVFGTNLLHYMVAESVLSHGYSYALFALLLLATDRWRRGTGGWKTAVFAGCVAGVLGMVRASNLAFVPCALLWGVGEGKAWKGRMARGWRELLLAGGCCLAVFSFQLWTWKCMSGHWLLNAYGAQGEGFSWLRPEIVNVLFSLRGGVFFWCPVLSVGLAGLFLARGGRGAPWRWTAVVYVLLQVWVVASWHDWAYGGGFGHRGFIETYALWVFPMAAWMEWCEVRGWWIRWGNRAVCLGCVAWCLFFMKLYYVREVSYFGLDGQALFDIFYNRAYAVREWVRGWMGR